LGSRTAAGERCPRIAWCARAEGRRSGRSGRRASPHRRPWQEAPCHTAGETERSPLPRPHRRLSSTRRRGVRAAGDLLHGGAQQPRIERFAFGKGRKKKCCGVENETGFAGFRGSIEGCGGRGVRGHHVWVFQVRGWKGAARSWAGAPAGQNKARVVNAGGIRRYGSSEPF